MSTMMESYAAILILCSGRSGKDQRSLLDLMLQEMNFMLGTCMRFNIQQSQKAWMM